MHKINTCLNNISALLVVTLSIIFIERSLHRYAFNSGALTVPSPSYMQTISGSSENMQISEAYMAARRYLMLSRLSVTKLVKYFANTFLHHHEAEHGTSISMEAHS